MSDTDSSRPPSPASSLDSPRPPSPASSLDSSRPPSPVSPKPLEGVDVALTSFVNGLQPPPRREDWEDRKVVVHTLHNIISTWCMKEKIPNGLGHMKPDNLFSLQVTGSARLGVFDASSDIDILLITALYISREDFFDGLASTLKEADQVSDLRCIEFTPVPIIELVVNKIPVDLLLSQLSLAILPCPFNVFDNRALRSLESKTLRSINAARVTEYNLMYAQGAHAFPLFVKAVRLWAKARGIYGNKYGYFGGVQCSLLALIIVQVTLGGGERSLVEYLFQFFQDYATYDWEKSVLQLKPYPGDLTDVINWFNDRRKYDEVMVVLTPTQPFTNATFNVNPNTLIHIKREFERGRCHMTDFVNAKTREDRTSALENLFGKWSICNHMEPKMTSFLKVTLGCKAVDPDGDLTERGEEEFGFCEGLVDSKVRMLALLLTKKMREIIDEAILFPKCWNEGPPLHSKHWVIGIVFSEAQRKEKRRISLVPIIREFRETKLTTLQEMKTCYLNTTVMELKEAIEFYNTF